MATSRQRPISTSLTDVTKTDSRDDLLACILNLTSAYEGLIFNASFMWSPKWFQARDMQPAKAKTQPAASIVI
jgi:hypothetical protein